MKKSLLVAALALTMCVPAFAEEQFTNDKARANRYPVFGNESSNLADLGLQEEDEAVKAAKKSESYGLANATQEDDDLSMSSGRFKKGYGAKEITDPNDPDYVPPVQPKKAKKKGEAKPDYSKMPVIVKGDHVEYENGTGDFVATGKVKLGQGPTELSTNYAFGNMKTGDIYLLEGGTIMEPGNRTEGKWAHYNYNTKTGEMKEVKGRGFKDSYTAPHVMLMPDKLIADQGGTTTRCTAKEHTPCLHVKAKTLEIYPKEKIVAHDVKVYMKGLHVYSRKLWINDLNKERSNFLRPSFGWNGGDNGFYGKLSFDEQLSKKDSVSADLYQYSRAGFKPEYKFHHYEKNWDFRYFNGWQEDDDWWYHKQNDFRFRYKPHHFIKGIPLTISANYEYGLWSKWNPKNDKTRTFNYTGLGGKAGTKSWHREYAYYVNHDPIKIFGPDTTLHLTYGRKWVHESLSDENRITNMYYQTLRQKVGSNLNLWVSNLRENKTSSLFDLSSSDMDREFRAGAQYRFGKNDTFSIVNRYDYQKHEQYQTTYTWFHRFCCWAFEVSYEKNWHTYDNPRRNDDARKLMFHFFFYNW